MKKSDRFGKILFCLYALMVLFLIVGSEAAIACCDTQHTYSVKGIDSKDTLNIRQLPSAKAKVIGKIPAKGASQISITESSYVETIECVNKPTLDPEVNVFKEDDDSLFVRFGKIMDKAPVGNELPSQTWCRITYENIKGWVNAKYLKYVCSQEIGDTGSKGPCKPIAWAKFDSKIKEYVLSFAKDTDLDCNEIDAKIVQKIGKNTVCKKEEWDVSAKTPVLYYHCLWSRVTVYVSKSKKDCLQLKTLLQSSP